MGLSHGRYRRLCWSRSSWRTCFEGAAVDTAYFDAAVSVKHAKHAVRTAFRRQVADAFMHWSGCAMFLRSPAACVA